MKHRCYGVLPMAGKGARLQPIAFSKELYPVVYKSKHYAVSEFSVRAMLEAKVDEIKLVISPEKMDLVKFYANYPAPISIYFNKSKSEPESVLFPIDSMNDNDICLFGLPDTLFTPVKSQLKVRKVLEAGADICLGMFEMEDGNLFDSVLFDQDMTVKQIKLKHNPPALSNWIWGIWGAKVSLLKRMKKMLLDQFEIGTEIRMGQLFNMLVNDKKINFKCVKAGSQYYDIGSVDAVVRANEVINGFKFE